MRNLKYVIPVLVVLLVVVGGWLFWEEQRHNLQNSTDDSGLPSQSQRAAALALIPQQGVNLYSLPNNQVQNLTITPQISSKTIGTMIAHIQPAVILGSNSLKPVAIGASVQQYIPSVVISSPEIPTGCPAQFVTAMISDNQGGVWIADEDNGIYHGIPSAGLYPFTWIQFDTDNSPGLVSDNIYSLCMDHSGRLWAGTLRDGVCVFNGKKWANYTILNGPLGSHIYAIGSNPLEGSVWMCTENGISIYDTNQNTWRYITRADGLPPNPDCIAFAKDGTAYVGTQCDGLAISSYPYQEWQVIRGPDQLTTTPYGSSLPGNLINSVAIANNGTIFVGTDEGLGISDDGGKSFHYQRGRDYADKVKGLWHPPAKWEYSSEQVLGNLLPEDHITCLSADNARNLWIGTWRNGYERLDIPQHAVYLDGASAQIRNMTGYVNAILPLGSGTLIGWYGGGVTISGGAQPAIQTDQIASTRKTIPPLPIAALSLTDAQLNSLKTQLITASQQIKSIHFPWAVSLSEDWTTQGDWAGRYGREFALLCCGNWPGDFGIVARDYGEDIYGMVGPHYNKKEGIRVYQQSLDTDNPKSLYIPELGYRRQTNWDDHGETYPVTFQGPDIWVRVNLYDPGIYRLSLYFINQDGHSGANRQRDYEIGIYAVPNNTVQYLQIPLLTSRAFAKNPVALAWAKEAMQTSPLAQQRVTNFWNPVYIRFAVAGPGEYMVHIDRNYSLNTELCGVFIDHTDAAFRPFNDPPVVTEFGGVNYQPPAVPQPYIQQNPVFCALWNDAEHAFDPASLGLRDAARIMAYRYAADHQVLSALLARWRWDLDIWTPLDRQEFDDAMNKSFWTYVSNWPGLKQWMQQNHKLMSNSGELANG